jgi:N4-gp56 family major capsid protein
MALGFEENLNMNKTTSAGIQPLYQPVLNRHVLMTAKADLIYSQFGQKAKIEKGKGKTVAWDKISPLPKALAPLTEGITPEGVALNMSRIVGYPMQYGSYVSTTDEFDFFTPNPPPEVLRINELLGNNAGETLDYLTAKVLSSGTNVQYPNGKTTRASLTTSDVLTVAEIKKAVRTLKGNKAKKLKGNKYVAIIHTDIAHDLMNDPEWKYPHQYVDTKQIYEGEIGELYGVKFVESPDAIMFHGEQIAGYDELSVVKVDDKKIYIAETITAEQAEEITSATTKRKIIINDFVYTVSSVTAGKNGEAYITCSATVDESVAPDMKIYAGEGAANGKPVYSTLVIGADAYGVSDPKDIKTIMKPLGSGGTSDPLDQRSTQGWKAHHLCKILSNEYMVRIETVSTRY